MSRKIEATASYRPRVPWPVVFDDGGETVRNRPRRIHTRDQDAGATHWQGRGPRRSCDVSRTGNEVITCRVWPRARAGNGFGRAGASCGSKPSAGLWNGRRRMGTRSGYRHSFRPIGVRPSVAERVVGRWCHRICLHANLEHQARIPTLCTRQCYLCLRAEHRQHRHGNRQDWRSTETKSSNTFAAATTRVGNPGVNYGLDRHERLRVRSSGRRVWMMAAAVSPGIAIPALVYALMRVGAALYIDCHSKA